ncbi:MAG: hypothetical protein PHZ26_04055, partial [Candidatus Gracilibacteria bacterium]|nr:hypothetical protein [Candidatus Gracilibacteria bacterium]
TPPLIKEAVPFLLPLYAKGVGGIKTRGTSVFDNLLSLRDNLGQSSVLRTPPLIKEAVPFLLPLCIKEAKNSPFQQRGVGGLKLAELQYLIILRHFVIFPLIILRPSDTSFNKGGRKLPLSAKGGWGDFFGFISCIILIYIIG